MKNIRPIHRHVTQFWSEERSLTAFLILLIVEIFLIAPMQVKGHAIVLVNNAIFFLLLMTGVLTVTKRKSIQALLAMVVVLAIATRWASLFMQIPGLKILDGIFMLICITGFLAIVLWQVYREGPVTAHRIQGAVAAYLLLSILFAVGFGLLENIRPGSFQGQSQAQIQEGINRSFYYFSVVTLTTTGYGDITAVSPYARTLVMMEALIGQLYPAILIARLVSLHIEEKKDRRGR